MFGNDDHGSICRSKREVEVLTYQCGHPVVVGDRQSSMIISRRTSDSSNSASASLPRHAREFVSKDECDTP